MIDFGARETILRHIKDIKLMYVKMCSYDFGLEIQSSPAKAIGLFPVHFHTATSPEFKTPKDDERFLHTLPVYLPNAT